MNARAEIDQLTPGLRRFARALLIDAHDGRSEAGDALVQDTILHTLRGDRRPGAPVARVALYRALIERAARAKAPTEPSSARRATASATDTDAGAPMQPKSGRQESVGISGALEALSLEDRAALLLVTLEGFSYIEAADALKIPRMVLVQRLVRARSVVTSLIDDAHHGNRPAHLHLRLVT